MKNNFEERLEKVKKQASHEHVPQQVTAAEANDPLSFINPTDIVDLPSKGRFYPEGHPLRNKTSIEIKQMTAKEEDILTNKSFIRKGIVIDRLVYSLLIDKSIPVDSILVGDKNAIMIAARISAYGANYDVAINCTECGERNFINIDLTQIKIREIDQILSDAIKTQVIDYKQLETGNILIQLPKTKWIVECKLMDGVDETYILSLINKKREKGEIAELSILEQLKIIVVSINNVYDQETVQKAVENMPASDAKCLRNAYQKLIPNVTIEKKFSCSSCEEEQELEVPFTQEFFWPK